MITIPVRLRWLFALLVAFSLVLPHLTPPGATLPSGESTYVAAGSAASGATMAPAAVAEGLSAFLPGAGDVPGGESFGDAFAGDLSYETDKLLLLFFMRWGRALASWNSVYFAVQSTDPVFPFERPPKPTVA